MTVADYGNHADPRYIHVQLPVQGHREPIDLLAPAMNLHYYQLIPGAAFPLMPQRVPTPEPPDWFSKLDDTQICDEIPVYNEDSVTEETFKPQEPHVELRNSPSKICDSKRRRLAARERALAGRKKVASPSKTKSPSKNKRNRIPKVGRKRSTNSESKKKNKSALLVNKTDTQSHEDSPSPSKSKKVSRRNRKQVNSTLTERRKSYESQNQDWQQAKSTGNEENRHPEVRMADKNPWLIERKTKSSPSKRVKRPKSIQSSPPVKTRSSVDYHSESIQTDQDQEYPKPFRMSLNKKVPKRNPLGSSEEHMHATEVPSPSEKQLVHEEEGRDKTRDSRKDLFQELPRNVEDEPRHAKEEPWQRSGGPMLNEVENEVQLITSDEKKSESNSSESKNIEPEISIKSNKPFIKTRNKPKTQYISSPVETDKAKRNRERLMERMNKRRQNSQRKRKNRKNRQSKTDNHQPKSSSAARSSVNKGSNHGSRVEKSKPITRKTLTRSNNCVIEEKKSYSSENQYLHRSQSAPRRGVSVEDDLDSPLPNWESEQIPESIMAELNSARELLSRYNLMVDKRLTSEGSQETEDMENSPFNFSQDTSLPDLNRNKLQRMMSTPAPGRKFKRHGRSLSISSGDLSGSKATSRSRTGKLKKRHASRGEIKSYLGKMIPANIATQKEQQDKLEFVVYFALGKGGKRFNPLMLTVSKDWTFKKCIRKALAEMQRRPETAVMDELKWINRYDVNSKNGIKAIRSDLRVLMGDHMVEHRGSNLSNKPADYTKQFVNKLWIVPRKGLKFSSERMNSKSGDWSKATASVRKETRRMRKVSNSDLLI